LQVGAFGYAKMGPYRGAQAEMLRVPFADLNCTKLPETAGDKWEDDFVLLADIFPTDYYATKLAMVQPGTSVGVFGAEPVGLLTAYSALLQGTAQVFVVDYIPERLDLVKNIGAIPIDFTKSDPVAQIKAILSEKEGTSEPIPPEEQKMATVLSSMDHWRLYGKRSRSHR
jgi:glutathione-independent formaldehyde dehydrogenase